MNSPLGLEIGGCYQNLEFRGPGDDTGLGVHGIARFAATPELTLAGKMEYVFRDDLNDGTVVGDDADYRLTRQFSVLGSNEVYDELEENLFLVGGRPHALLIWSKPR